MSIALVVILLAALCTTLVAYARANKTAATLKAKYAGAEEAEALATRRRVEAQELEATIEQKHKDWETKYRAALSEFSALTTEVESYRDQAEVQSFGFYKPQYSFTTSAEYEAELEVIRGRQSTMLKAKNAAICPKEWTVDGNRAKGRQMTDRNLKLMLRAFNGECDASVAKVNYRNVTTLEERIRKSFKTINDLGEPNFCSIVPAYLGLKIEELRLAHEHEEKIHAEKEEQKQIRERMREEEKANREIERAREEAEKEEDRYEVALRRAKADAEKATATQRAEVDAKIAKLQALLVDAQAKKQRAISQAELTRQGHVYVLSNEGSFGPNMFKVGMTRRLDPQDRVDELGSASVPFQFDVHALIHSENAPDLETKLHQALEPHRVNLVNQRKEFFRIPIEKIVDLVTQHHGHFEFTMLAEAAEFRKTLAVRAEREAMVTGRDARTTAVSRVAELQSRFDQVRKSLS